VYVFGGGAVSSYDHILRYDPSSGNVSQVGTLPSRASDVAVAALGGTAYVVGGYDEVHALDTVVAWRPGAPARVVCHLPFGLRYAAVAAVGTRLIIAGGTTAAGALSSSILSFDSATSTVTRIGRLPVPLTHASAAPFGGGALIVGGRRELSGAQTATILAIDPASGVARIVGKLPQPLSDAGAVTTGDQVIVAGGRGSSGPVNSIVALTAGKR
jgi:N-acetylneuraminic acid mutarotase